MSGQGDLPPTRADTSVERLDAILARGRCVRCGRKDRADGTYLCAPCRGDQATFREMSEARREVLKLLPEDGGRDQRRYLIGVCHWAGGWPRSR